MIRLYVYRTSQASTLIEANQDGAIRYINTFESTTVADLAEIDKVKLYCNLVAEMCDNTETLCFVEEEADLVRTDHSTLGFIYDNREK